MEAYDRGKGLVKGLFWGGLIGVIIGILFITKRNKGTWEDIGKSADELVDKTKEQLEQARMKMEELVHRGQVSAAGETESLKEAGVPGPERSFQRRPRPFLTGSSAQR